MRNVDPIAFFSEHRDTIFRICGALGTLLILFLLLRAVAMRMGGWSAARARVVRELAVTRHAFAAPVRNWYRHRRDLRYLTRALRSPLTWRDAERAMAAARPLCAPARPYAAVVGRGLVLVRLAGPAGSTPAPPAPWAIGVDDDGEDDPTLWAIAREDLPMVPMTPVTRPAGDPAPVTDPATDDGAREYRPVLVAVGRDGGDGGCAFLDVGSGPPVIGIEGDGRNREVLLRTLAAQVDARLPAGLVTVSEGVHPRHAGLPVREAYRRVRETPAERGYGPVLVAPHAPDPLPAEFAEPVRRSDAPRFLLGSPGRGHVRLLLTDRHGRVVVTGTPLLTIAGALARAVARALPDIPPVIPPMPPAGSGTGVRGELFEEFDETDGAGGSTVGEESSGPAGRPTVPMAKASDAFEAPARRAVPSDPARSAGTVSVGAGVGAGDPARSARSTAAPIDAGAGESGAGATVPTADGTGDEEVDSGARASSSGRSARTPDGSSRT
ncbi:hypothetical protein [Streptomyces sp. ST2-7A]|uniref:hypothetical protein n=1 Tax=Streptomyces sp. ST2-7A TaxID=2907214 RepID=UPI001F27F924|nr:hypothetical protein [Streptomyces sp. ST2-7A]MCE7083378.1 hypothetical protein [Streptomyces sp. ST2-7A]